MLCKLEPARHIVRYVVLHEFFELANTHLPTAVRSQHESVQRILVIKLGHFGDALHVIPMLRSLKAQRPEADIDLVIGPWCIDFAKSISYVDEVIAYEPQLEVFHRRNPVQKPSLFQEIRLLRRMRRRMYDVVISSSTTTPVESLMEIAVRGRHWIGTEPTAHLYTRAGQRSTVPYDSQEYEADRVMGLLTLAGMERGDNELAYEISHAAVQRVDEMLAACGLRPNDRCVVIGLGAGWPDKRWPVERFATLADRIANRFEVKIILIGASGEADLGVQASSLMTHSVVNLIGRTRLDELAALVRRSDIFIGNDSGPMHFAAVYNVASVCFFGPTVLSKWAPKGACHEALQKDAPCNDCWGWHPRAQCIHDNRCMKSISVEEAYTAVEKQMSRLGITSRQIVSST